RARVVLGVRSQGSAGSARYWRVDCASVQRKPTTQGNRMKLITIFVALILAGCSTYAPDAGHQIVLIEKPWFFGHGGVATDPVQTGRTFAAITTDGVDVEMRPQRYELDLPD